MTNKAAQLLIQPSLLKIISFAYTKGITSSREIHGDAHIPARRVLVVLGDHDLSWTDYKQIG